MRHGNRARASVAAWVATGIISGAGSALADVGRRDFIDTMLIEDPQPDDTLTFPGFSMQSFNGGGGEPPTREYEFGFEVEKRITARLSLSLSDGYSIITTPGRKSQTGWQQLEMGAKLEAVRLPEHEFVLSL